MGDRGPWVAVRDLSHPEACSKSWLVRVSVDRLAVIWGGRKGSSLNNVRQVTLRLLITVTAYDFRD